MFELSSVPVDEAPKRQGSTADPPLGYAGVGMHTIRYPGAIPTAVGQCIAEIMERFNSIKHRGSGWRWERSQKMVIHASRVVDKIPASGSAGERRILEAIATPQRDDSNEMEIDSDGAAGTYVPNPRWIKDRGFSPYVFNPRPYTHKRTDDDLCFSWCILRAQNPYGVRRPGGESSADIVPGLEKNSRRYQRVKADEIPEGRSPFYTHGNVADLAEGIALGHLSHVALPQGMSYPVVLRTDVFTAIEDLNGFSFSIFKVGSRELMPYYCSRRQAPGKPHYRLGLIQSTVPIKTRQSVYGAMDPDHFNFHFILIHDLVGIEGAVKDNHRYYGRDVNREYAANREPTADTLICDNCMAKFSAKSKKNTYAEHIRACIFNEPTRLLLPKEDRAKLRFDKFQYTQVKPFVIYADLEAINEPRGAEDRDVSESLTILTDHTVSSWAYQIVVATPYRHLFSERKGAGGRPFSEMRSMGGPGCMEVREPLESPLKES